MVQILFDNGQTTHFQEWGKRSAYICDNIIYDKDPLRKAVESKIQFDPMTKRQPFSSFSPTGFAQEMSKLTVQCRLQGHFINLNELLLPTMGNQSSPLSNDITEP